MDLSEIAAETTTERESSKLMDATEPMEEESSAAVTTSPKKRKAESDIAKETDEAESDIAKETDKNGGERNYFEWLTEEKIWESDYESEEESEYNSEEDTEEKRRERFLGPEPEWDVDSFDGVEYNSAEDKHLEEICREYKRQIIESKGFYVDPKVRRGLGGSRIHSVDLEEKAGGGQNFRDYFGDMARLCLDKYNSEENIKKNNGFKVEFVRVERGMYFCGERSKSYITFMAREQPGGPEVEYQAKTWCTYKLGEDYPILCRPASTVKPTNQNK